MTKFEKFIYNVGYTMAAVKDFIKPKSNWIIPFVMGMVAWHYLKEVL